jgi:hypothetical protein
LDDDFAVMIIIIFWLILSVVIGVVASNRGRSGIGWFFLSMLISPVLALLFLIACRDLRMEAQFQKASPQINDATKVCPRCAETIKQAAKVCRFCGVEFQIEAPSPRHAPSSCPLDPFEIARTSPSELGTRLDALSFEQLVKVATDCQMNKDGYAKGWQRNDLIRHIWEEAVKSVRAEKAALG